MSLAGRNARELRTVVCPACGATVELDGLGMTREHLFGLRRCSGACRSAAGMAAEIVDGSRPARRRRSAIRPG